MLLLKNTATHPVCLTSGRVLAPGETGDGDPTGGDAEQVAVGNLTRVQDATAPTRKTAQKEQP